VKSTSRYNKAPPIPIPHHMMPPFGDNAAGRLVVLSTYTQEKGRASVASRGLVGANYLALVVETRT
jgi:hypothetical protein